METIAFRLLLPTGPSKVLSSGSQLSLKQLCLGHGREHRHTSKILGSSIRQHWVRTDRGEIETLLSETLSQFQVQSGEGWWDSWKLASQVHCLGDRCLWRAGQWFRNHWLTFETRWLLLTPRPVTGRLFFPSCIWKKKTCVEDRGHASVEPRVCVPDLLTDDDHPGDTHYCHLHFKEQHETERGWESCCFLVPLEVVRCGCRRLKEQNLYASKSEFRALPSWKNNVTVV